MAVHNMDIILISRCNRRIVTGEAKYRKQSYVKKLLR